MPLVLTENDATESGISYSDLTGSIYQFPKMYRRIVRPGLPFVYYKGRKAKAGGRVPQIYFGSGVTGEITEDVSAPDRLLCKIEHFKPFRKPLFFKRPDGSYFETGAVRRGYFQRGVRQISQDEFDSILSSATALDFYTDSSAIRYGLPDQNFEVEQFAVCHAVKLLQLNYPGTEVLVQARNNPGYDILVHSSPGPLYVEVKGTRSLTPQFFATNNEVNFSSSFASQYLLMVFYAVDTANDKFQLVQHRGAIRPALELEPIQFLCRFPKNVAL